MGFLFCVKSVSALVYDKIKIHQHCSKTVLDTLVEGFSNLMIDDLDKNVRATQATCDVFSSKRFGILKDL